MTQMEMTTMTPKSERFIYCHLPGVTLALCAERIMRDLEYCADTIALYQGKLVLVERLKFPLGYALPGGRRDPVDAGGRMDLEDTLEGPVECAIREFVEETGLELTVQGELGRYDTPGRDPRGPKVSTTVYGTAQGKMRDEPGKTRVFLMDLGDVERNKNRFAFDHYQMLQDAKERGIIKW